jgi:antitoxin (DNA-binding transcriptional repressor) of toxin-antitoxin stability system
MHQVNLQEAKIVPLNTAQTSPKFGSAKGLIKMSDDFDEPIEDFEEYTL